MKKEDDVATKKITIERFSITSTKPFAEVVSAIAAQVGHHFNTKQFRFHGPDGFEADVSEHLDFARVYREPESLLAASQRTFTRRHFLIGRLLGGLDSECLYWLPRIFHVDHV